MSWKATASDADAVRLALEVALKAQAQGETVELPPDLAGWCGHLFWLNSCLSAHALVPGMLSGDEVEGLRMIDEVTRELSHKLLRCPHCGGFSESQLSCSRCKKAIPSAAEPQGRR